MSEEIPSSFGLSRVLASAGVDVSSFNAFLGEGESNSKDFADVELDDDDDAKFEDDVSDAELPAESAEEVAARARESEARRRDEERWMKRGMEMVKANEAKEKEKAQGKGKKKGKDGVEEEEESEMERVLKIWPGFEKGKRLRMSEVFYETPLDKKAYAQERKKRRVDDKKEFTFTVAPHPYPSLPSTFLLSSLPSLDTPQPNLPNYTTSVGALFDKQWTREAKDRRRIEMTRPPAGVDLSRPLDVAEWAAAGKGSALEMLDWEQGIIMCPLNLPDQQDDILAPRNDFLDAGEWVKDVIWDAQRVSAELLESDEEEPAEAKPGAAVPAATKTGSAATAAAAAASKLDPFNLSNDPLYEHSRESRFRIRQTFGAIEVFHSLPAKHLQLPYYKTSLSKSEARAWRRPALQFPTGVTLSFSKLKSNPSASVNAKKKQMMADPSERFKSTKDLTLTEQGPYVLLEFSEEYPPIMSGYGMGTTIVNYYRKLDDKDEHVSKLDFGQPSILNPGDAEPFLLGYVDRGEVTQVIHNNLIRAPIFKHKAETTDFLCIRHTVNGHTTYHLRAINNLFTVGQTVPNESEVHGPHARKNTNTAKMRLMIIAWLLINKSKMKRFKIGKLLKYFPDQTELQMRQRLKVKGNEFLMYSRSPGPNQGYWMLNPDYAFPAERKAVLEMCSPEAAMLYEAMQVGARHLYDAGYKKTAEGGQEDEDESGLDIEQRLAVWSTTHNYKLAEAQKAWLVIHGEGDPTGRGEGFSFLRANMKNYFLRKGETEQGRRLEAEARAGGNPVKISNAEQNRIYEEEKRKVWDLQATALSNPVPPEITAYEEELARTSATPVGAGLGPRFQRADSRRAFSRGASMAATPVYGESPRDRSPSAFSMDGGESAFTGNQMQGKVLRIKRKVKGKDDKIKEVVEIVRDQAVIASYLRRNEEKKIEYYMEHPDEIELSKNNNEDDPDLQMQAQALKLLLEKNKLNQQRRLMRKKYQSKTLDTESMGIEGVDLEGKRKCGACGAIGHTKANRNCPMFNANANNASSSVQPSPTAGAGTPGYGGYTPIDTTTPAAQPTSIKIRLGMGQ